MDVYNDMMYLILPLHMHISGDGGVVLVDLEQEPHRDQDWSELPVVRYINHTSVCCSKHVRKATKSQCLRWLTKKNLQICCPAKHRKCTSK